MQRASALLSLGAVLALASAPLLANGNAANGKTKAAACFACHGADGNSIDPQYPRLAGQYSQYLQQVLHEYKNGERSNPIMKGMVTTLSDQDIEDISTYFAGLPTKLDTLKGHIQGD
ncbi:MAG: cytochrome C [Rhodanobacter sp. 68-29]|uniref:c-type cytochrome n=1 Tax=Rhodanobacter sp. PCA2 TaxID=2006117 RepID=UPI00086F2670|nr:cytochrome c [Rhodanobacter sp. PCA2]MBA2078335.1 cytochrome C [Rhodanobacter sp. PCA2]MBN8924059.1 cytochrome c [Rhodanobacter sp.]ODU74691.1 MAG: cytochrome C [Rhodanobacter sp. SCN 69-32]OJY58092.1 MAG: cytochrome C [Rhodanobacter sp. 68-29]